MFERGFLRVNYELNYRKLGLRKGLLHVYLKDGNLEGIADQIARINGIQSTSIHIGNSDIVALFIFRETQQLLDIISDCKKLQGVDRVVWSEEVLNVQARSEYRK